MTSAPRTAARRVPVGRITAVLAVAVGVFIVLRGGGKPHFRALHTGVEFATFAGEPYCRRGSSQVGVLRLDPARVRLAVRHYSREPERRPLTVIEWLKRTRSVAVFNAGQYYPGYAYMGLLVGQGKAISSHLHAQYQAALVAEPVSGEPGARVLDLSHDPLDPRRLAWREVAQSFMLFDSAGTVRTRRTNQIANRTVVGEDREGRLLVITSEGGYTLHEFAKLLQTTPLHLTHAMSMDGGYEANLLVESGRFRYASFGQWQGEEEGEGPGARVPLPAVITVDLR